MAKEQDEKVQVETGKIELPKIDVSKYVGKKAKIENAEIFQSKKFGSYYAKIQTKIVDTLGTGDKKIELRGSRVFGLHQDEDGNVGWADNTKLGVFLTKMKVKSLKELVGKEVILQTQTNESGTDFLSFN